MYNFTLTGFHVKSFLTIYYKFSLKKMFAIIIKHFVLYAILISFIYLWWDKINPSLKKIYIYREKKLNDFRNAHKKVSFNDSST